jgi:outer membrane biosynthesis protein TonB
MKRSGLMLVRGAALLCLVAAVACSGRSATTEPASPGWKAQGTAGFEFLADHGPPSLQLGPAEEIVAPSPNLLAPPVYPQEALDSGCGGGTTGLRIVIGLDGNVIQVDDSPLVTSTGGTCGARFRAAAEEAVHAWEFEPAVWRRLEPGEDYDGDGEPDFERVTASEQIKIYLDVRFTFAVVRGEGRVRMGT